MLTMEKKELSEEEIIKENVRVSKEILEILDKSNDLQK